MSASGLCITRLLFRLRKMHCRRSIQTLRQDMFRKNQTLYNQLPTIPESPVLDFGLSRAFVLDIVQGRNERAPVYIAFAGRFLRSVFQRALLQPDGWHGQAFCRPLPQDELAERHGGVLRARVALDPAGRLS